MTKVAILPGHEYDLVSPDDLEAHFVRVTALFEQQQREALRGIKVIRFQPLYMNVTAGNFSGILQGPRGGYSWVVRRISLFGVAAADINTATVNVFFGDQAKPSGFIDQLNVNAAWTGSSERLILHGTETLYVIGSGASTSTQVVVTGSVIETPAEMVGKLL